MGLEMVRRVGRYQGQCRALRPLGHQGYRLRIYKKDPPLRSGYMVAEEIKTLLLESPWTRLDHRALAGLSTVLSPSVFPLRLHSWHVPSGPKIVLLSVLTVVIDIGLEFLLVVVVVWTPHLTSNPVENLPPQVNLVPTLPLCLILKTAAAKESRRILELVRILVNVGKITSKKS